MMNINEVVALFPSRIEGASVYNATLHRAVNLFILNNKILFDFFPPLNNSVITSSAVKRAPVTEYYWHHGFLLSLLFAIL